MSNIFSTPKIPQPKQEVVEPTPPIDLEASSVDIGGSDDTKKKKTGKSQLRVPLATTSGTGLKV